jgi:hypothetical protein
MTDDDILAELRALEPSSKATAIASKLEELVPGGLTQSVLVSYFKRAFPAIPLRTILDAAAWHRIGGGRLSDEGFNALLSQWLPRKNESEGP